MCARSCLRGELNACAHGLAVGVKHLRGAFFVHEGAREGVGLARFEVAVGHRVREREGLRRVCHVQAGGGVGQRGGNVGPVDHPGALCLARHVVMARVQLALCVIDPLTRHDAHPSKPAQVAVDTDLIGPAALKLEFCARAQHVTSRVLQYIARLVAQFKLHDVRAGFEVLVRPCIDKSLVAQRIGCLRPVATEQLRGQHGNPGVFHRTQVDGCLVLTDGDLEAHEFGALAGRRCELGEGVGVVGERSQHVVGLARSLSVAVEPKTRIRVEKRLVDCTRCSIPSGVVGIRAVGVGPNCSRGVDVSGGIRHHDMAFVRCRAFNKEGDPGHGGLGVLIYLVEGDIATDNLVGTCVFAPGHRACLADFHGAHRVVEEIAAAGCHLTQVVRAKGKRHIDAVAIGIGCGCAIVCLDGHDCLRGTRLHVLKRLGRVHGAVHRHIMFACVVDGKRRSVEARSAPRVCAAVFGINFANANTAHDLLLRDGCCHVERDPLAARLVGREMAHVDRRVDLVALRGLGLLYGHGTERQVGPSAKLVQLVSAHLVALKQQRHSVLVGLENPGALGCGGIVTAQVVFGVGTLVVAHGDLGALKRHVALRHIGTSLRIYLAHHDGLGVTLRLLEHLAAVLLVDARRLARLHLNAVHRLIEGVSAARLGLMHPIRSLVERA